MGNPHYYMDPERMAAVARALAGRLGALDPPHKEAFANRAAAFAKAVDERVAAWRRQAAGAPGAVFYHNDGSYLAGLSRRAGVGLHRATARYSAYGVAHARPRRSSHGAKGVILYNSFHPSEGPAFLGRQLGWKTAQLQLEAPLDATGAMYLEHINQWVNAITGATP